MLQLAVLTSSQHAPQILRAARAHTGVANVVHLPGAVVQPHGDLIEVQVAREAADGLLALLRPLCLEQGGSMAVTELAAAFGDPITTAEREAPGAGVDAVVWEQIAQRTEEDSQLTVTFLVFLVAATLICSAGLLTDSSVLVVGGMVLGPEFAPLAAIAVGLTRRRWGAVLRAARTLLIGFPLAVLVTAGGVALLRVTAGIPDVYLDGGRSLTSFVSHPDVFSVVVALIAGVAGTVSLTSAKSNALVGVFISVTTIPAAANIGTALLTDRPGEALGATVQLLVNLLCLLLSATATLLLAQRFGRHAPSGGTARISRAALRRGGPPARR